MPKKKPVNWPAIKKRWLAGELASAIEKDYETDAKAITNKAFREGWKRQKETIQENVLVSVQDDLKALCDVTLRVHTKFMLNLEGQIKDIQNPYLLDGERTNSLFQTAMNNSVKVMLASMKAQDDGEADDETPGFNIAPDA